MRPCGACFACCRQTSPPPAGRRVHCPPRPRFHSRAIHRAGSSKLPKRFHISSVTTPSLPVRATRRLRERRRPTAPSPDADEGGAPNEPASELPARPPASEDGGGPKDPTSDNVPSCDGGAPKEPASDPTSSGATKETERDAGADGGEPTDPASLHAPSPAASSPAASDAATPSDGGPATPLTDGGSAARASADCVRERACAPMLGLTRDTARSNDTGAPLPAA